MKLLHFVLSSLVLTLHITRGSSENGHWSRSNLKSTLLAMLESLDGENNEVCAPEQPANCGEILLLGYTKSGIYTIFPRPWYNKAPFKVYCDMDTEGGGWTVFQRRDDLEIKEDFYRGWYDYQKGFGDLQGEFWLGNDQLYLLTNQDHVTMRIDLEDFEENKRHVHYSKVQLANIHDNFRLSIGGFTGDVGDDMASLNQLIFVTKDRNDVNNCSKLFKGGWWYKNCHLANLNGLNLRGKHTSHADGIEWKSFKGHNYSLKKSEMKVRPTNFLHYKKK